MMDSAVAYGVELEDCTRERLNEFLTEEDNNPIFSGRQGKPKTLMNAILPQKCSNAANQVSRDEQKERSENADEKDSHKEVIKGKMNQSCHVEVDSSDKVKTKLMSMWNNMKYGWTVKVKTNFSYESPIWLLGKCYHKKLQGEVCPAESSNFAARSLCMELFKQDFFSRIWFTYRREFHSLAGSSLTTDCGWGCMLRSGQMLLAQALICHFLSRDWRWNWIKTSRNETYHRTILRWFGDHPCFSSPFSVHQLVALGESSGKKAGDWYGPASVAHILKQAQETAAKHIPLLDTICVYVAQDCTIYQQDIFDLCCKPPQRHLFSESEGQYYCCGEKDYTQNKSSSVQDNTKTAKWCVTEKKQPQILSDMASSNGSDRVDSGFTDWENLTHDFQNHSKNLENVAEDGTELQGYDLNFMPNHFSESGSASASRNTERASDYIQDNKIEHSKEASSLNSFSHETTHKSGNFTICTDRVNYSSHSPILTEGSCYKKSETHWDTRRRRSQYSLAHSTSVPSPSTEEAPHFPDFSDIDTDSKKHNIDSSVSHDHSYWRRGIIILVPVRLGGDVLNRAYIPHVRDLLTQEHCIGIIGGRPKHSLYFVGWQDDKFIYLDPHYCQETVDVCTPDFPLQSFHCSVPRKVLCTKMDPSCTIGFYCKRRNDFLEFIRYTKQILSLYKRKGDYPIFTIQEGRQEDAAMKLDDLAKDEYLAEALSCSWIPDDEFETVQVDGEDYVVI